MALIRIIAAMQTLCSKASQLLLNEINTSGNEGSILQAAKEECTGECGLLLHRELKIPYHMHR